MEATVEEELKLLLNERISPGALSTVDDVVLSYIVSVLEQLGEDEQFDVDDFCEMMAAYIPGFDTVNREDICSWMHHLAERLVHTRRSSTQIKEDRTSTENCNVNFLHAPSISAEERLMGDASVEISSLHEQKSFMSSADHTLSAGCKSTYEGTNHDHMHQGNSERGNASDGVSVLMEIFPGACSLEIEQFLSVANGDTESALHLMLLKNSASKEDDGNENCQGIIEAHRPSAKREEPQETDKDNLKEQVMARYGYVDLREDEITHQPRFYTQENKKPLRYRDNQVVSTKGERFSWVKQEESEDMKKTYVNLKPARKYRFH